MEKTFYKSPDGRLIDSVSTIMSRVGLMDGPSDDPRDHFCKSVCGRIAGGLVMDTPVKDLHEVKRWLDDIIDYRDAPPVRAGFKPF